MKIGMLTSGGDCAGLNSVIYGFGKAITIMEPKVDLYGIAGGYAGLVNSDYKKIKSEDFAIY